MISKTLLIVPVILALLTQDVMAQNMDAAALSAAFASAADKCRKSVVSINVGLSKVTRKRIKHLEEHFNRSGGEFNPDDMPQGGIGSGVIVRSDGYILTNEHVIDDVDEDSILVTLYDGRRFFADIIGADPSSDLALLRIYAHNLESTRLAQPESVRLGELVIAIGSPLGLKFTVTSGVISALNRDDIDDEEYSVKRYIQTDAAINPGNSGGGLFRLQGDLVGINSAILSRTGFNIGYGLALTTDLVAAVYSDLKADGVISRPSLGVSARSESFDSSLVIDRNKVDETVIIDKIKPNGAADKAGIKVGDIIRSLNGLLVRTKDNITQHMALFHPGQRIAVGLGRRGDTLSLDVVLDTMSLPFPQRDRAQMRRPYLGARVNSDDDAYILKDVKRYGPTDHAGLQDGDKLLSVNDAPIQSNDQLSRVVASSKPGDKIIVTCDRHGSKVIGYIIVGATVAKQ